MWKMLKEALCGLECGSGDEVHPLCRSPGSCPQHCTTLGVVGMPKTSELGKGGRRIKYRVILSCALCLRLTTKMHTHSPQIGRLG